MKHASKANASTVAQLNHDALIEIVSQVFRSVLNIAVVGKDDDFFALGGQSIRATKAINLIRIYSSKEISFEEFYLRPTVEGVAASLQHAKSSRPPIKPRNR